MSETGSNSYTPAPDIAKIDAKVVKKMVGDAISRIDGILDVKDGMTDMFKSDDDLTRGMSVTVTDDQQAVINVKIISEAGKNIPEIVERASEAITNELQNTAGLKVKEICIEVSDTMTREEFEGSKNSGQDAPVMPVM